MEAPPDAPTSPSLSMIEDVLARLAASPDPERALRLLDALLRLPPITLAELERQAEADNDTR